MLGLACNTQRCLTYRAAVEAARGPWVTLRQGAGWAHHFHAVLLHAPAGLEVCADALACALLEFGELTAAGFNDGLDLLLGLLRDGHHAVQVLIHKETHKHLWEIRVVGQAILGCPRLHSAPLNPAPLTLKALRRSGSMPSGSFILSLSSWSSWSSSSSSAAGALPTVRSSGQPLTSVLIES